MRQTFYRYERWRGKPNSGVHVACKVNPQQPKPSKKKIDIKQADFPGGIQIWGSNPAFLWTSDRAEEEGIHIHAWRGSTNLPEIDETYAEVIIDGINLDPVMVRVLMAQSALPSLKGRVLSFNCPSCGEGHLSLGECAFTGFPNHTCRHCGHTFASRGRLRKTVGNPLLSILGRLADKAPRAPQRHELNLLPETP